MDSRLHLRLGQTHCAPGREHTLYQMVAAVKFIVLAYEVFRCQLPVLLQFGLHLAGYLVQDFRCGLLGDGRTLVQGSKCHLLGNLASLEHTPLIAGTRQLHRLACW